jgi:hypothetical protein
VRIIHAGKLSLSVRSRCSSRKCLRIGSSGGFPHVSNGTAQLSPVPVLTPTLGQRAVRLNPGNFGIQARFDSVMTRCLLVLISSLIIMTTRWTCGPIYPRYDSVKPATSLSFAGEETRCSNFCFEDYPTSRPRLESITQSQPH